MRHSLFGVVFLIGCGSALRAPPSPTRRAVIAGGLASLAAGVGQRPAHASLTTELREAEGVLSAAQDTDSITASLEKLRDILEEYEGLQGPELSKELVNAMRAKRTGLQGSKVWTGIPEEAYNSLMRKVDPWRVTELQPKLQYSIFAAAPAYVALIAVQQLVPKVFPVAYGGAAVVVLGPLLAQILIG